MPLDSLRPPHHWRGRADEMRLVATATDRIVAKGALAVGADHYDDLAKFAEGWHAGSRVTRKHGDEEGTVVEANDRIKVLSDGGQTSYYLRDKPANVRLLGEGRL